MISIADAAGDRCAAAPTAATSLLRAQMGARLINEMIPAIEQALMRAHAIRSSAQAMSAALGRGTQRRRQGRGAQGGQRDLVRDRRARKARSAPIPQRPATRVLIAAAA